ncbi:hypothetical protein K450DRAFT_251577 [Umbelopsis ramanniana AG]|uniref:Uncharacterized protein n=1 Tax=Umbelopsis ramanniana AG TaxID=1314678 RepID=A0AAD5E569_UMBRA|nr:uncharacterized protein K450DRAFT_251577 [Umbelopsis ramanniana AG]KAI8577596.1 hypothetical protein K450DRAFT_251577 [Umbelopsis ramanniana AG]
MPLRKSIVATTDLSIYVVDVTPEGQVVTGGSSYDDSGVQNRIDVYDLSGKGNKLVPYTSLSMESFRSNDISLAVHPSSSIIAVGLSVPAPSSAGKDCKILDLTGSSIVPRLAVRINSSSQSEYTQTITRFSASGKYLIAGFNDGKIAVLRYPSMTGLFPPLTIGEILDVDLQTHCGEEVLAVASPKTIRLINVRTGAVIEVIESPMLNQTTAGTFAACRFGRHSSRGYLYAVVNVTSNHKSGAFICLWQLGKRIHSTLRKGKTASVTRSPITAFNMSSDGSLLTYAAEDNSIGVINASTLQPVYRLRNAHENPIFTITMSSDNSFIASAAGNQLRVTPLPNTISKGNSFELIPN